MFVGIAFVCLSASAQENKIVCNEGSEIALVDANQVSVKRPNFLYSIVFDNPWKLNGDVTQFSGREEYVVIPNAMLNGPASGKVTFNATGAPYNDEEVACARQ